MGVVSDRVGGGVGDRRVAMNESTDVDRLVDVDVLVDVHVLEEADVEWRSHFVSPAVVLINGGRMSAPTARRQATGRGSPYQRFIGILIFGRSNLRMYDLSA